MGNYLEVKRTLGEMLGALNANEIDEDSDIIVPISRRKNRKTDASILDFEEAEKSIENELIRNAFDSISSKKVNEMQLYSDTSYEVAILSGLIRNSKVELEDSVNEIKYHLEYASLEYILMICEKMIDENFSKEAVLANVRYFGKILATDDISSDEFIKKYFRIRTIRIEANKTTQLKSFEQFCDSFEYLYMFKTRLSILKILNLSDLFDSNIGGCSRSREIEEPPRRKVNPETLEFYAMAVDSEDPFTKYISFYHVLEYYFDEVYKKKLVNEMKNKLTNPNFSYKNEKMVYDLAKWVGKKMKNDDEDGRGNELDSLKYLLEEYAPINDLLVALDTWNPELKDYYQTHSVTFSGSNKKDKIAWSDLNGVYTNLSNRIYNTRNALVHSKSEQIDKQYRPQKHKAVLAKELPLIQVIAELIIFKDGDTL